MDKDGRRKCDRCHIHRGRKGCSVKLKRDGLTSSAPRLSGPVSGAAFFGQVSEALVCRGEAGNDLVSTVEFPHFGRESTPSPPPGWQVDTTRAGMGVLRGSRAGL
jgi:hypothetical protein